MGPKSQYGDYLHALKYRQREETFRDAMMRMATAMTSFDTRGHFENLRDILLATRFVPAGRVQAAMGAARRVSAFNCFVSGTIPDSFVDRGNEHSSSIMHRAEQCATTMRMGGGVGHDFSTLRPRGALIRKLQSSSTGPVQFMHLFDAVGQATSSAGHRRGAQMGVLRVDHPDIIEFINVKHREGVLEGFNLSIGVTDDFMTCVARGDKFDLTFDDEIYRTVDAQELWEMIMRSTWDWGDPGVLFLDTINKMNNLWYCEKICATNPCGEQPLPPHGACLLGSFNLPQYLSRNDRGDWYLDTYQLEEDIPHVVEAMDNVIDRTTYPLQEQQTEAQSKRRMGLGVLGLANALETMGHPYGSAEFCLIEQQILATIAREAYRASSQLATRRGSFELYDEEMYLQSQFVRTLDEDTQSLILKRGIRNSHLTSIAPTGTIAMCYDNVSGGIEPVFAERTKRPVNVGVDQQPIMIDELDYALANFGTVPRTCDQVTAAEHISVLLTAARHVDSAVSKTCNVTSDMPWSDFKNLYQTAWEGGAKGCTTFNSGGMKMSLLKSSAACTYDPSTGTKTCEG